MLQSNLRSGPAFQQPEQNLPTQLAIGLWHHRNPARAVLGKVKQAERRPKPCMAGSFHKSKPAHFLANTMWQAWANSSDNLAKAQFGNHAKRIGM